MPFSKSIVHFGYHSCELMILIVDVPEGRGVERITEETWRRYKIGVGPFRVLDPLFTDSVTSLLQL